MNGVKPGSGIDPSPSNEWKQVCNRCILPEVNIMIDNHAKNYFYQTYMYIP